MTQHMLDFTFVVERENDRKQRVHIHALIISAITCQNDTFIKA